MSSEHHDDSSTESNRDAALDRAWREASTERPPSHLDAALVAAARKSAGQVAEARVRRRPVPWLLRWQPLLAAAGVAGLALVLVPMLPREHAPAPAMPRQQSSEVPVVESAPGSSSTTDDVAVAQPVPPPPAAESMTERRERIAPAPRRPESASEVPAPVAAPAPTRAPSTASAEASRGEFDSTSDAAAESGGTAAAAASGEARSTPPLDAAARAARIEALHGSGDFAAAARELRAFRAADADADAHLPEHLREWARTVEPFPPHQPQ